MTLELILQKTGQILDTIVIEGDRIAYRTGKAAGVVGARDVRQLVGWTNGYVTFREA